MVEYISREAVMQKFADHVKRSNNSDFAPTPTWNEAVQIVEDIPAADVRPVVRGKWKVSVHKAYYDVSCSVCGINSFFQVDEKDSVSYANYCPNCGSDMRESKQESKQVGILEEES